LRLEPLEAREVPADLTLTVNTLNDVVNANDGLTSLREALTAATEAGAGAHTINFAQAQQGGTITLSDADTHRDLTVSPNMGVTGVEIRIDGSAAGITIQRSANTEVAHRLLSVGTGAYLMIENLTFTNGKSPSLGGAIWCAGDLKLTDCTFTNNQAATSGGALFFSGNYFYSTGAAFYFNSAETGFGGATTFFRAGSAAIHDAQFVGNWAQAGGAVAVFSRETGGPTQIALTGTEMLLNSAVTRGGAIFVAASGVGVYLQVQTSTLESNWVANPDQQYQTKGGGIYFGKGTLDVISLTISNNDAKKGDGIYLVVPGAAIFGSPTYQNDALEQGPA
jgi:predicted outer membrane repeat protein